ncbi:MAG: hypothetical protein IJX44_05395 [Bacteroidaceae bacterium]|nr:hypothetical protein [Bacteroidaceae bacterium]
MKHQIIGILLGIGLLTGSIAWATNRNATQKVELENIVSPTKVEYDSVWYARQAEGWAKEIKKNPKNEYAWRNYYLASKYQWTWFNPSPYSKDRSTKNATNFLEGILINMEKNIPDSHVLNILRYFHDGKWDEKYKEGVMRAIAEGPDDLLFFPDYAAFMLRWDMEEELTKLCQKMYESGEYSPTLLNYAYNELVGVEPGSILLTYGDVPTYSKLLIQKGKGLFPDVHVISTALLYFEDYRKSIFTKLGIPLDIAAEDRNGEGLIRHIIRHSRQPVYFSTNSAIPKEGLKDSLYSEGLVMRYSAKPYDNISIKRRNYEKRYLLDYLQESFSPERYTTSADRLKLNYVVVFQSLLKHYREAGDEARLKELHQLLEKVIDNVGLTPERREGYLNFINEAYEGK